MRRRLWLILMAAGAILIPATANADAGTPLMMTQVLHLFVGNAIIGICEGLIIAYFFKAGWLRASLLMIPANYFSAWVGYIGLSELARRIVHSDIYRVHAIVIAVVPISFLATLVLEWPFVWLALKGVEKRLPKSVTASLVAQAASYAVLVPWYWSVSETGLYQNASLDRSLAFVRNAGAWVYFIPPDGRSVERCRLNGSGAGTVMTISPDKPGTWGERLAVKKPDKQEEWDLHLIRYKEHGSDQELLKARFARYPYVLQDSADYGDGFPNGQGECFDLRPKADRAWSFYMGSALGRGALRVSSGSSDERFSLMLDTPFLSWDVRYATVLPGDEVVFQLGDQIVVFDRPTRKIGLIATGMSPVVVLEELNGPAASISN